MVKNNGLSPCHSLAPIAAAVLALIATASPAQSIVSSTGDVSPPFTPAANVDLTGSRVFLGFTSGSVGTTGQIDLTAGGVLTAAQIVPGTGGLGTGVVNVTGAGSRISLTGGAAFNGLDIGSWGIGTLSVSSGGQIVCASPLACPFNGIGNGAGSTGTVIVDAGTIAGLGSVSVGSGNLSPGFGTAGANTSATLSILNGGTISSSGFNSVASNGGQTGLVTGSVSIDGTGSSWLVSRDVVNGGGQAFLALANAANTSADVTISNGGNLTITGARVTPATDSSLAGINMSTAAGATSTMTVTSGGSVRIGGTTGVITLGGNSNVGTPGATATLNITDGGTVAGTGTSGLVFMAIGQNQGTGTVNVSGVGSQLTVSGVGELNTQGLDGVAGLIQVGRNRNGGGGGTGSLNVSAGGTVVISDGGPAASIGSPGLQVGSGLGSSGAVTIDGSGSTIQVTSTALGVPTGTPDNLNPSVHIGGTDGNGSLGISNGGKLLITGNAVSTPAAPRTTYLGIGGISDSGVGTASTGSATVTGLGSEIRMTGSDAFITVGRGAGAVGTLTISDQASVTAGIGNIGRAGGTGALILNNGTLNLSGTFGQNPTFGSGLGVGNRGGTGTATLSNGSQINITNLGTGGAGVSIGGTEVNPLGTGTLTMSGGSSINITAASGQANFTVGRDGTGIATLSQGSIVDIGDGVAHIGRLAGGSGTLNMTGGSKLLAGQIAIGGSSDAVAGGVGTATVGGLNSELRATGSVAYISVGLGGTGTLVVNDQAQVNATALGVGRALGGVGTMTVSNGSILLSGQETAAPFAGANLSIGVDGGSGSVSVANGSTIAITNSGSAGASLNVGGSPIRPLGTGTLNVTNSQIDITTAPGLAAARIGHDGTGTATLTASSLNLSNGTTRDGSIIVAGLPGSVGTLVLNAGSVINAAYVGVGSTRNPAFDPVTNPTQNPGGIGRLVVNDSEVNTDVFELGAFGVLSGNNGVINVAGDVIIGGTIDPGNSAGRIRINSNLISLPGSRLILEIQSDGSGGFLTDTLVIDSASPFDLRNFDIVFSFLGDTNVQEFAASGGFDFDTFLRSGVGADESQGLSNRFAAGETWADMFDATEITVVSSVFDVSNLSIGSDGGVTVTASRIPEPETWLMMLIGLFAMRLVAPRRRRTFAVAH